MDKRNISNIVFKKKSMLLSFIYMDMSLISLDITKILFGGQLREILSCLIFYP